MFVRKGSHYVQYECGRKVQLSVHLRQEDVDFTDQELTLMLCKWSIDRIYLRENSCRALPI